MKIVIITTGQPSVNPRVVKEADALQAAGFNVVLLYCYWVSWANEADKNLLKNVKWSYQLVGGTPSSKKFLYFLTKARCKINFIVNRNRLNKQLIAERSQARCYDELLNTAKSIKADWYIGHNLGALPVTVRAAAHNKALAGFDFEDYHREENLGLKQAFLRRIVYLEEKYISRLNYISTSSPQITEKVKLNFPSFKRPFFTLLNCFSLKQKPERLTFSATGNLTLFWFSQTIGKGRGLEAVLTALKELNNKSIHLTLAGRCDEETMECFKEIAANVKECVHFTGIIPPNQLPTFAAGFDVGLATEIATPLNRNICLTNKIFTYLLAGNCILASDTEAQKDFMVRYAEVGLLYRNDDIKDLTEKINFLYQNWNVLKRFKENAFDLASNTLNWENESKKLIKTIAAITAKGDC